MDKFGIISYNKYGNFTNYGSVLQTWALSRVVNRLGKGRYSSVVIDYCPKSHMRCNILNPIPLMWDQDEQSQKECILSLPAIQANNDKINMFFAKQLTWTKLRFDYTNFDKEIGKENLCGFICGSDTIFCTDETKGFDDGFFGQYETMRKGFTIAYAASFGDSHFDEASLDILQERMKNFKAVGIREHVLLPYLETHCNIPIKQTLDPTLLLEAKEYDEITATRQLKEPYILLYARRYNEEMFSYAEQLAKEMKCQLVDISLRASNASKGHIMRYDAGVDEFLSLIKHSEYVVTNSYHGLIFSIQFKRPFRVFKREQADTKIAEVLRLTDISTQRKASLAFLEKSINQYYKK